MALLLRSRYRALRPIGQGGFGRTFLAIDQDLPSQPACVIKQLYLPQASAVVLDKAIALFHQEAVHLEQLGQHPQIPQLLAHFEQEQRFYLVQEWIDGHTLAVEAAQQKFTEPQVRQLLRELLPLLQFIHDRQVIHRDIKPANLMRRRIDQRWVLIDFGIAKPMSLSPQTGTIVGSPEYMAPEQTRGKVVPASDLYSLGVVCLQLLTQVSPTELFDIERNSWTWRKALPPGRRVSSQLGRILDRLLQPALQDRYGSAAAVWQDLEEAGSIGPDLAAGSSPMRPLIAAVTVPPVIQPDPTQPDPAQPGTISLSAADLQPLEQLLRHREWQKADSYTWGLIRQLLHKPTYRYLLAGELTSLPEADLRRIDQCWQRSSQGRYGFTVQVQIYRQVGEDYGAFCDRVGWSKDNLHDQPSQWRFESTAPIGHLPSRLYIGGQQWWRHIAILATKLTH